MVPTANLRWVRTAGTTFKKGDRRCRLEATLAVLALAGFSDTQPAVTYLFSAEGTHQILVEALNAAGSSN